MQANPYKIRKDRKMLRIAEEDMRKEYYIHDSCKGT